MLLTGGLASGHLRMLAACPKSARHKAREGISIDEDRSTTVIYNHRRMDSFSRKAFRSCTWLGARCKT